MASLKELFDGEFGRIFKCNQVATYTSPAGMSQVPQKLYCDFDGCVCFLGCYVATEFVTPDLLFSIVQQHDAATSTLKSGVVVSGGHIAIYQAPGPSLDDLPFNGRIILYIDAALDDALKQSLVAHGTSLGVWVQIRDRTYEDFITLHEVTLGFISHDSRDKDTFVRPLAEKLRSALCPVWYDEFSMKPGASLRESIDAGLRDSKRCVVVLSSNFFTNPGWGKGEFNAIMNRHFTSGGNVLIPIWHGVTYGQVADYSQLVADIFAINSDIGLDAVFDKLRRALLTSANSSTTTPSK